MRDGHRYLDLLSGFGVFGIGRNHPAVRDALKDVLDNDLPNLVQLDVSTLAGILAERLLAHVPYLDKVFFANSGAEAVEAAIKFSRMATGRAGLVFCDHAYHGLTNGALSLNGDAIFRDGFGPLLPDCTRCAVQRSRGAGARVVARKVAAFIVEPIQGKGVNMPAAGYLQAAAELCRRTARCSSPTKSRPAWAAPGGSLRSSTGMSSPTSCCSRKRCRAGTCRAAPC